MPTIQNLSSKEGKVQVVDSSGTIIDAFSGLLTDLGDSFPTGKTRVYGTMIYTFAADDTKYDVWSPGTAPWTTGKTLYITDIHIMLLQSAQIAIGDNQASITGDDTNDGITILRLAGGSASAHFHFEVPLKFETAMSMLCTVATSVYMSYDGWEE